MNNFDKYQINSRNSVHLCIAFFMALLFCLFCLPTDALADKAAAKMYEKSVNQHKRLSASTSFALWDIAYTKGDSGMVYSKEDITLAVRIDNGKAAETIKNRIHSYYETTYGKRAGSVSTDYWIYNKNGMYSWYYNPYDPKTPREQIRQTSGVLPNFVPLSISMNRLESNESTIKYLEKYGEIKGDTITCASEEQIMLEAKPVKKMNCIIKFDEKGRIVSFEASGKTALTPPGYDEPNRFTFSKRLTYEYAPQQPALSEVGVINETISRGNKAVGYYKSVAPDGAELPYSGELPSLPSPLLEIGLEVNFTDEQGKMTANYSISHVTPLTPKTRPGYFLGDAAQSIDRFDPQYNYIWLGSGGYGASPDIMIIIWDDGAKKWTLLPQLDERIKDRGKFYCVANSNDMITLMIQQHDKYMP